MLTRHLEEAGLHANNILVYRKLKITTLYGEVRVVAALEQTNVISSLFLSLYLQ